jgi:carboxyl-terminal processing protease
MRRLAALAAGATALLGAAPAPVPMAADYLADARSLDAEIASTYAYLDRFPGGAVPTSPPLAAEREAVHDRESLLRYAEHRLFALADHHAITNRSFPDDWGLAPSYADLWIVTDRQGFRIDAVRENSPAAAAGIVAGDRLIAVAGVPMATAVAAFWAPIGRPAASDADAFAARVLAVGRRDRPRDLTVLGRAGERRLSLPSLYAAPHDEPAVAVTAARGRTVIRLGNSLGEQTTIAAFDAAMARLPDTAPLTLDLTDTPSGGNTSVARAIMGWFVDRPTGYQVHNLAAEERETGIARQWIEQVLPRAGKRHHGPVTVRVGRWTGSMGEGLAIGMAAAGARVCGTAMAGLRGAVYDVTLPKTGLVVKLPAERLSAVDGTPREAYRPAACRD